MGYNSSSNASESVNEKYIGKLLKSEMVGSRDSAYGKLTFHGIDGNKTIIYADSDGDGLAGFLFCEVDPPRTPSPAAKSKSKSPPTKPRSKSKSPSAKTSSGGKRTRKHRNLQNKHNYARV
jgi:hypothetical protein